jgi:hypothetical protein
VVVMTEARAKARLLSRCEPTNQLGQRRMRRLHRDASSIQALAASGMSGPPCLIDSSYASSAWTRNDRASACNRLARLDSSGRGETRTPWLAKAARATPARPGRFGPVCPSLSRVTNCYGRMTWFSSQSHGRSNRVRSTAALPLQRIRVADNSGNASPTLRSRNGTGQVSTGSGLPPALLCCERPCIADNLIQKRMG